MTSTELLYKSFQILGELMNEDCFDFLEVAPLTFEERKEYLRNMIFEYFNSGETNLAGVIQRADSKLETSENVNNFFKNEELVADIILLMDEDMYELFENEI